MTKTDREIYEFFQRLRTGNLVNFINRHCGKLIGRGIHRDVYILKKNRNYVVKIEREMDNGSFSNIMEWKFYNDNEDYSNFSKWLAPSIAIDQTGQILIQRRVIFKDIGEYPKEIPRIFTDLKIQNYGWIGNRFVCCDYSSLLIGFNLKLKKAKWWDVDE